MMKSIQYLAYAGVVILGLQWPTANLASEKSPDIEISGTIWETSSGGQEFENIQKGISVALSPKTDFQFPEDNQILQLLHDVCSQIAADPAGFAKNGFVPASLEFIYITIEKGNQTLFPYATRHRLADGKCTGAMGFQMPTLSARFSQHDPNDEFFAVTHSWGLGLPEVSFETGSKSNVIAVEIERLANFNRELETVSSLALCVHALANIESEVKFLALTIRPQDFSKIEIELIEPKQSTIGNARKVVGRIEFAVKNGMCGPLTGGN